MKSNRVYFKRYIPPWIEEEGMKIARGYFSQFTGEQLQEDCNDDDFTAYVEMHSSEEYRLWMKYCMFAGDEGELLDRNGDCLLDNNGKPIQAWNTDADGYLFYISGEPIYYCDGERVKEPCREDYLPYIDKWFPEKE